MTTYLIIGIIFAAFILVCGVTGNVSKFEADAREPMFWVAVLLWIFVWPLVVMYIIKERTKKYKGTES